MRPTPPLGEFVKGRGLCAELLLAIHFTSRDKNQHGKVVREKGRQEGSAGILRQDGRRGAIRRRQQGSGGYLLLLHFQMSCPVNSTSVGINTRYFLLSYQ